MSSNLYSFIKRSITNRLKNLIPNFLLESVTEDITSSLATAVKELYVDHVHYTMTNISNDAQRQYEEQVLLNKLINELVYRKLITITKVNDPRNYTTTTRYSISVLNTEEIK